MAYRVSIRGLAQADAREAQRWYREIRKDLARDFRERMKACVAVIQSDPLRPALIADGVRYVPMIRFPYGIFYLVLDDEIVIIAILHHRRNPEIWKQRGQNE